MLKCFDDLTLRIFSLRTINLLRDYPSPHFIKDTKKMAHNSDLKLPE